MISVGELVDLVNPLISLSLPLSLHVIQTRPFPDVVVLFFFYPSHFRLPCTGIFTKVFAGPDDLVTYQHHFCFRF